MSLKRIAWSCYYKSPAIVQDLAFTMYGAYLNAQRYNKHFYDHLDFLKNSQWWDEGKIREFKNRKFLELVRHAYSTVPFYRKFYDEAGVNINDIKLLDDIERLPVLTKSMVREHCPEMVSSAFGKSEVTDDLTSGTTGTPLLVKKRKQDVAFQWAVWWRHKSRFDIGVNDSHLTFGGKSLVSQNQSTKPYWRQEYLGNRSYLSVYHISKRTVKDIVDYINSRGFVFLTGSPSAMYTLATIAASENLKIVQKPKYIVCGADALLPNYEEAINDFFGAPVTEQYGMVEFAGNLSKCERGNFHEDFECGHAEYLDLEGGSGIKNLVLTGWGNMAMPFIRYEVGDYCEGFVESCECGRKSNAVRRIEGRLEDYLVTRDGRRIMGMNQVFMHAENALKIQIYQPSINAVQFRVVPGEKFDESDKAALVHELEKRAGKGTFNINFDFVDEIETSDSGKMKAVVSEVKQ